MVDSKGLLENKLSQYVKKKELPTNIFVLKVVRKYSSLLSSIDNQSREKVYTRLDKFWKTEILPLRNTDATVLLVSHGGVISVLRKYLIRNNYRVDDSLMNSRHDFWEVRNCSITEIRLGEKGSGEFIRMGDWGHIIQEATADVTRERLENSTG